MEGNLSGIIIRMKYALDDRKESFHLFVRAEDMCDEGRVVRIVMEMRTMMLMSGGDEKMRACKYSARGSLFTLE